MSDTQAEAEAPLPWTEQHLKSALINLIEAAKNSVRGPERGGSENAVSGIYQQIVAAWNTRAQPKPEVAPDDEAMFSRAIKATCDWFGMAANVTVEVNNEFGASWEALRRRIAEMRATSLKYQLAFGDRDNDAHRLADRVAELEAALAACRDKIIEDACAAVDATILDERQSRITQAAIRALKTKEPTNG